jgi:hypothetical protein
MLFLSLLLFLIRRYFSDLAVAVANFEGPKDKTLVVLSYSERLGNKNAGNDAWKVIAQGQLEGGFLPA